MRIDQPSRQPLHLLAAVLVAGCSTSTPAGTLPSLPGTPCASPIDLTHAASFDGDTCDGGVAVPLEPCAASAPATVFGFAAQSQSSRRRFYVTDGFVTLVAGPMSCMFESGLCDAGGEMGTSLAPGAASYLAVARGDGTCGPFHLDVYNASSCTDSGDAASCTCGSSPACPAGQVCITPPGVTGECSTP